MNLLIQAANIYTPAALKRKKLEELFACTAGAFGCETPRVHGLPYEEMLRSYARFTAAQADRALRRGGDLADIQRRLYDGAYRMGRELRRTFRVANTADALAAARVLYHAIGIDLRTTPDGEVTIHRCFFSDYYSSPVCQVIAALDEGLFAGLSGGGQLAFSRRITEGNSHCEARFRQSERSAWGRESPGPEAAVLKGPGSASCTQPVRALSSQPERFSVGTIGSPEDQENNP